MPATAAPAGGLVAALRARAQEGFRRLLPSASSSSPSRGDLRASLDAWSLASKWLRTARPHEVDRELRSMLVLEPEARRDETKAKATATTKKKRKTVAKTETGKQSAK